MTLHFDGSPEAKIGGKQPRKIRQDGGQQPKAQVKRSRSPINRPVIFT